MWKHKNFINLQLCAGEIVFYIPAGTYTFKDTFTVPDDTLTGTFDFKSNGLSFTQIDVYSSKGGSVVFLGTGDRTVASGGSWGDTDYQTIVLEEDSVTVQVDFYNWFMTNTVSATPTLTFKHFYDAGLQGTGTIKFRHYSQQEPSTGETWVLNESPTLIQYAKQFDISFTSNSNSYTYLKFGEDSIGIAQALYYGTTQVYEDGNNAWSNAAYRTITFASAPTGDLLTWLQANGTKQGGGVISGYTVEYTLKGDMGGATMPMFIYNGKKYGRYANELNGDGKTYKDDEVIPNTTIMTGTLHIPSVPVTITWGYPDYLDYANKTGDVVITEGTRRKLDGTITINGNGSFEMQGSD